MIDKPKAIDKKTFQKNMKKDLQPVFVKLDAAISKILPDFDQKVSWGGWCYKKEKNYSCMITEYKDHLKLMLMLGIQFKDPDNVLEGVGISTRHIKYYTEKDVDAKALKFFIDQQQKLFKAGVHYEKGK